jgi:hypothetical protein
VSAERSWVYTGLGLPVELTCTVYSNPGTDQLILQYLDPIYADTKRTLIKKQRKFSSYIRKLQMGSVAKSYMRKGFLIYEEMRKYVTIYEEVISHI